MGLSRTRCSNKFACTTRNSASRYPASSVAQSTARSDASEPSTPTTTNFSVISMGSEFLTLTPRHLTNCDAGTPKQQVSKVTSKAWSRQESTIFWKEWVRTEGMGFETRPETSAATSPAHIGRQSAVDEILVVSRYVATFSPSRAVTVTPRALSNSLLHSVRGGRTWRHVLRRKAIWRLIR